MPAPAKIGTVRRLIDARTLRLGSGLVLGLFLLMHFSNIALGLVSVRAMQVAEPFIMAPWRSAVGTLLLSGALLTHFALALRALYKRRTLRMSAREAAQLALGLLIPVLLADHVVETRILPALGGPLVDFADVAQILWSRAPLRGLQQVAVLVVAWGHVCLGLWFWLRTKSSFPAAAGPLLAAALLVPTLALLGFAEAGKEMAAQPARPLGPFPGLGWLPAPLIAPAIRGGFGTSVAAVLVARLVRWWRSRHRLIRIAYPNDRIVTVPAGYSILEASRLARIPHASICGGRGRCSTCRVRILHGLDAQPAPSHQEAATLGRFDADRNVRLACQLRPTRDLTVLPIFAPTPDPMALVQGRASGAASHERDLAILFCDLRAFTRRTEQWLPFDTVYILNRYFELVGRAVEEAGGYLDKFIGDGALALFGLDVPSDVACRQALVAATSVATALGRLNEEMAEQLAEPLRVAMGLHTGPAIVGEMGYGRATGLTAIGDGINVASRLEGAAKEIDVEAVVSVDLARKAGFAMSALPQRLIAVRGRKASVEALLVERAAELAGLLGEPLTRAHDRGPC